MKITIKNLGALEQAEFEIGDLTIICGANNTGKTYATHAVYGFFDFLRTASEFSIDQAVLNKLLNAGAVQIDLNKYTDDLQNQINRLAKQYSKQLYRVFAGTEKLFQDAQLNMKVSKTLKFAGKEKIKISFGSSEKQILQIESIDNSILEARLIVSDKDELPPVHIISDMIEDAIRMALFGNIIPKPFLASAERTGAAIFQKELDFTRNRLIDLIGDKDAKLTPFRLFGRFKGEYPIAVRKNVDFIRDIPNITNRESYILKKHPDLLESFADIIGGAYFVSKEGEIKYVPSGSKRTKLALVESSSAVRSLLDIGFYLRHIAQKGDLLMVDEPELNLHPANQRRIARLFAQLVNIDIKVFITTHSDYIIKELNTLIMLNQDKRYLKKIMQNEKYSEAELLCADRVKVYIAKEDSILKKGNVRKTKCLTLVSANVNQELGIEVDSFDATIDEMNRIQEAIVWGGDE